MKKSDLLCLLNKKFLKQNNIVKICFFSLNFLIIFIQFSTPIGYADNFTAIVNETCNDHGLEPELVIALIKAESNFNPRAVSKVDARGLMQLTRATWDWICEQYLQVSWSFDEYAFDPEKNIKVGTRFLRWIRDYLSKHTQELNAEADDLLLACYNAGPGAVKRYGFRIPPFSETQNYISKINNSLK